MSGSFRSRLEKNGRLVKGGSAKGGSDSPLADKNETEKRGDGEMADIWEFYKDEAREWRWRRQAANGAIVGESSEGYKRIGHCKENAARNGWTAEAGWSVREA